MLLTIPDILSTAQLKEFREVLGQARWVDGRTTAGHFAAEVKRNQQLAPDDPGGARLADILLDALAREPLFVSATLPLKVLPPRFNRYEGGGEYGLHVDGAVLSVPGTSHRVRTDVSATVFISDPADYDGGELIIEDVYGPRTVKLPAGHMVLYPGTSLHRVTPVTRGTRLASFFWVQSLVQDQQQRTLLFELDSSIRRLAARLPGDPELDRLTAVYHNLVRRWAST